LPQIVQIETPPYKILNVQVGRYRHIVLVLTTLERENG
jgi:hypothetical protein